MAGISKSGFTNLSLCHELHGTKQSYFTFQFQISILTVHIILVTASITKVPTHNS